MTIIASVVKTAGAFYVQSWSEGSPVGRNLYETGISADVDNFSISPLDKIEILCYDKITQKVILLWR